MGKRFEPKDIECICYLSSPAISDDGKWTAYVASKGDPESGIFFSQIMATSVQGDEKALYAAENSSQEQPTWIGRDQLAYLSDESGQKQIWLYNLQTGEKRQLTTARHGVTRFTAVEGCKSIAFELELWREDIEAGCQFEIMTAEEADAWKKELEYRPYEITDLTYKMDEWYGMRKGQLSQIALVDLTTGEQALLSTFEMESIFPVLEPDGSRVAYYGYPHKGAKGRQPELYLCEIKDGNSRQMTENQGVYADTYPAFTAGSDEVIFMAVPELKDCSTILLPYAVSVENGKVRAVIGHDEEHICHGVHPFPGNRTEYKETQSYFKITEEFIYFLSSFHGRESIYRKNLYESEAKVECVVKGDTAIHSFTLSKSGSLAYMMANFKRPAELYIQQAANQPAACCTDSNSWLAEYEIPETEEFWIKSKDGKADLQVWLMHPAVQKDDRLYPAVLYIRGGPECTYNADFWHEFLALAHAGLAVIYTNPRGGMGYGKDFCAGGIAWAQEAMDDLVSAVEASVEKGFIDAKRVGVTGGSYGGYMTNKFIGRTKHFAAAVSQRCLINPATSYGTGDMGFISANPEAKDVKMLEYLEDRARGNAITYIDNMKVPLLLLHGYRDYRCSFEQAEQLFIAMKDRNPEIPVRMVMFPEENHGVARIGKLYNQVRHLEELTNWMTKYLTEGGEKDA